MKLLLLGLCVFVTLLVENVSAQRKPLRGGFTPISADSDKIKQLALFSLSTVAQQSGSERALGLIRVVSAQSQVVAGTNYKMTLLVCEKYATDNQSNYMDYQACRSCDITLWEQVWLNKKGVTGVACTEPSELTINVQRY